MCSTWRVHAACPPTYTPPGTTQHDMKTNRIKKFKIDSMTGLPFAVIDHEVHDPQYDVEGAVEDTEKVEEAHEVSMLVGCVCVPWVVRTLRCIWAVALRLTSLGAPPIAVVGDSQELEGAGSFEKFVHDHDIAMVNFYAPWCIWCKRLVCSATACDRMPWLLMH